MKPVIALLAVLLFAATATTCGISVMLIASSQVAQAGPNP